MAVSRLPAMERPGRPLPEPAVSHMCPNQVVSSALAILGIGPDMSRWRRLANAFGRKTDRGGRAPELRVAAPGESCEAELPKRFPQPDSVGDSGPVTRIVVSGAER